MYNISLSCGWDGSPKKVEFRCLVRTGGLVCGSKSRGSISGSSINIAAITEAASEEASNVAEYDKSIAALASDECCKHDGRGVPFAPHRTWPCLALVYPPLYVQ